MTDLESKIEKLFDNVTTIRETIIKSTTTQEEILRRVELSEKAVENLTIREMNCPGKLYAMRKASIFEAVKDGAIILGIVLVIMQIIGVIK